MIHSIDRFSLKTTLHELENIDAPYKISKACGPNIWFIHRGCYSQIFMFEHSNSYFEQREYLERLLNIKSKPLPIIEAQ